ncbi:hypothetical protein VU04_11825 [Desulfobulbus sp. TB]|nr:hypothetical protein [Desulfobulbus sp. TB]
MQPTSGGSGDCHVANHPRKDQDATEEAVYQGQAGTNLPFLRNLRQDFLGLTFSIMPEDLFVPMEEAPE